MKDETILRAAFYISIIGIIALFVLDMNIGIGSYTIKDAISSGGDVSITGVIKGIKTGKGSVVLTIKDDSGDISAVLFDKYVNLKKGDRIRVEGRISEYKGKKQLEVRKITAE